MPPSRPRCMMRPSARTPTPSASPAAGGDPLPAPGAGARHKACTMPVIDRGRVSAPGLAPIFFFPRRQSARSSPGGAGDFLRHRRFALLAMVPPDKAGHAGRRTMPERQQAGKSVDRRSRRQSGLAAGAATAASVCPAYSLTSKNATGKSYINYRVGLCRLGAIARLSRSRWHPVRRLLARNRGAIPDRAPKRLSGWRAGQYRELRASGSRQAAVPDDAV